MNLVGDGFNRTGGTIQFPPMSNRIQSIIAAHGFFDRPQVGIYTKIRVREKVDVFRLAIFLEEKNN
jgi:hypothetical protein